MEVHHKHGPIKNWREFAREIGIIVIGIVIALGGEQAIEAIQHRHEVQEVRKSLKDEMAFNLGTLKEAVDEIPCSTRRLDEIERWANSSRTGHPLQLARLADGPHLNIFRTAAWRAAPTDALARLPLEERNSYAYWYDGVATATVQRQTILALWADIRKLSRAHRLSEEQQLELADEIDQIRSTYKLMDSANNFYWPPLAKSLGVTPSKLRLPDEFLAAKADLCKPLLAS
jgi:hypothetical protein